MLAAEQGLQVEAEMMKAEHALEVHRCDLAIQIMQNLLRVYPEQNQAFVMMARAYVMKREKQKAIQALKEALRLDPEDDYANALYGRLLGEEKQWEEAENAFQTALSIYPYHALTHLWYGFFLLSQHKTDQAYHHAEVALELDPEEEEAHILMARILSEKGKLEQEEESLLQALRLAPDSYFTHFHYGLFLLTKKNERKKAFEYLREAIRMNPEDPELREVFLISLKAKNRVYGLFWSYSLFLHRFGKWKWGFIIGLYIMYRIVLYIARSSPDWAPFLIPIIVLYIVFCIFSWTADPLFNLFIRRGWIK
ncbi:tetratricopeptide repeat protein [Paenactinomyces guangxiensis]|uniref:Tetratricopeptide repeat protein n=1 Tax=Paenactinomyces guangxiensis TaxID=1490290 RepID=A0A7W1WUE4_9BACL|nr:tetratricopeptide repeat protein [Paenactinomyces guangxiensis]MBA4496168.1 tetratricopeptide repeat protein [Paenactinomyces guangxiensis]MBH8593257.1 tetratricopeptide repeat protein [Paenactinomyces guangxiensis]